MGSVNHYLSDTDFDWDTDSSDDEYDDEYDPETDVSSSDDEFEELEGDELTASLQRSLEHEVAHGFLEEGGGEARVWIYWKLML
ncbi:hypothetical protein BDN70DRAFT_881136 [Pholiota conissans]|uniref:Uncharacterized protein n=1 Tax=Pholiota conissans TaxID=109636 RepID=A0A9P5Z0L3_9AGAR|nr:hypothetical protein BDN70DRAFT_881136 [Pholiota conissans]